MDTIRLIENHASLTEAVKCAGSRRGVGLHGAGTASHGYLLAAYLNLVDANAPALVIAPTADTAERLYADLQAWSAHAPALFPASDLYLPGPDPVAPARLDVLDRLDAGEPVVVVSTLPATLQRTRRHVERLTLARGAEIDLAAFSDSLGKIGYDRAPMVERPGQFSVRGGILDVFPSTAEFPVRADLLGDEIESLREFDPDTQRSGSAVDSVHILAAAEAAEVASDASLIDFLSDASPVVIVEVNAVNAQWDEFARAADARYRTALKQEQEVVRLGSASPLHESHETPDVFRSWMARRPRLYLDVLERENPWEPAATPVSIPSLPVDVYRGRMDSLAAHLTQCAKDGVRTAIVSNSTQRLQELLAENGVAPQDGVLSLLHGEQRAGFRLPDLNLLVLTDAEVFGEREAHVARRRFKEAQPISSLLELKEGDLVVHIHHGIGHFRGLSVIKSPDGTQSEFLRIDYAGSDKIYVPTEQMDRVQKYIGSTERPPAINRLGGHEWARATSKAKAKAKEMAAELVALYAARQAVRVVPAGPDTSWQQEMESAFPYRETPDQTQAIREVKEDLQQAHPMDRLVCGDVGFGKTEVAVRAAFKMVNEGKQVAVLVPTTILAEQHMNTFRERMDAFPITIEMLSRFRTPKETKVILEGLRDGNVDIIIGTHRLLSKDIHFRDLGLLVVDEEQRFGVVHKERIKQMRRSVHVLTMTATPIPRTLHMGLAGIRELSVMNDPPEGRTPIRTILTEQSDALVREAILHETDRGGQVYLVHNRVEDIESIAQRLGKLVPTARITVGHGQMAEKHLEQVMWDFYHRRFDVLVCTTIIESGLDVPNANTIIINNADRFGLSQLYQLRGRVGRSPRQAYCYLLYRAHKQMSEEAEQRLQAVKEFSELGSGFKIAMRDLEIRGAGNLLGAEQSGMVASVGFEYYCQLIQQAVAEFKGEVDEQWNLPAADIPVPAFIPSDYIADDGLRIAFYKKVTAVREEKGLKTLQEEFEDRFGDPPKPVWNMLRLLGVRLKMKEGGLIALAGNQARVVVKLPRNLESDERWEMQRRRKRWTVEQSSIEIPVTNGDALRAAEDAIPRVIADLGR
ncbi:MAG TPA: transcription-repair coupling factor [Armatimonadota bacterium]|jgi:transcription-repair coupling factor (superfamily II helicase)